MKRREFIRALSGVVAWPLTARAQQPTVPVIGFLSSLSRDGSGPLIAAFERGLREVGYIPGQNLTIEYRWAAGQYERLPTLAADLIRKRVAILVTTGGEPAALAAKAASSTTPIVFNVGSDPVKMGLVASYNRPDSNATGMNILTESMEPKRLGILRELLPQTATLAVLFNPKFPPAEVQLKDIDGAARALGMKVLPFSASTEGDFEPAFQSIVQQQIPALIVATDPFFVARRSDLIALAARYSLPTVYGFRDLAVSGGLMSYGINLVDVYRQQAFYVGRILKGENVTNLPVMQPTKFDLVINLNTAKALGLAVPPTLLALADEVIE
jgi:putative ABC transport system substrate-binding protein